MEIYHEKEINNYINGYVGGALVVTAPIAATLTSCKDDTPISFTGSATTTEADGVTTSINVTLVGYTGDNLTDHNFVITDSTGTHEVNFDCTVNHKLSYTLTLTGTFAAGSATITINAPSGYKIENSIPCTLTGERFSGNATLIDDNGVTKKIGVTLVGYTGATLANGAFTITDAESKTITHTLEYSSPTYTLTLTDTFIAGNATITINASSGHKLANPIGCTLVGEFFTGSATTTVDDGVTTSINVTLVGYTGDNLTDHNFVITDSTGTHEVNFDCTVNHKLSYTLTLTGTFTAGSATITINEPDGYKLTNPIGCALTGVFFTGEATPVATNGVTTSIDVTLDDYNSTQLTDTAFTITDAESNTITHTLEYSSPTYTLTLTDTFIAGTAQIQITAPSGYKLADPIQFDLAGIFVLGNATPHETVGVTTSIDVTLTGYGEEEPLEDGDFTITDSASKEISYTLGYDGSTSTYTLTLTDTFTVGNATITCDLEDGYALGDTMSPYLSDSRTHFNGEWTVNNDATSGETRSISIALSNHYNSPYYFQQGDFTIEDSTGAEVEYSLSNPNSLNYVLHLNGSFAAGTATITINNVPEGYAFDGWTNTSDCTLVMDERDIVNLTSITTDNIEGTENFVTTEKISLTFDGTFNDNLEAVSDIVLFAPDGRTIEGGWTQPSANVSTYLYTVTGGTFLQGDTVLLNFDGVDDFHMINEATLPTLNKIGTFTTDQPDDIAVLDTGDVDMYIFMNGAPMDSYMFNDGENPAGLYFSISHTFTIDVDIACGDEAGSQYYFGITYNDGYGTTTINIKNIKNQTIGTFYAFHQ